MALRNSKMNVCEKYARINFMLKQTLTSSSFMLLTQLHLNSVIEIRFSLFFSSFWLLTLALVTFFQTVKKLDCCSLIILLFTTFDVFQQFWVRTNFVPWHCTQLWCHMGPQLVSVGDMGA